MMVAPGVDPSRSYARPKRAKSARPLPARGARAPREALGVAALHLARGALAAVDTTYARRSPRIAPAKPPLERATTPPRQPRRLRDDGGPRRRGRPDDVLPADHPRRDRQARPAGFAPIAIGLGLTLIHLIGIPVTNLSVNPARSTGPALFAEGGWALGQLWLFWVAPIIGGVLGGGLYRGLFERRA